MIKAVLKKMVVAFYRVFCHLVPVDPDLVVFDSDMGKNYSGSPRAIYEQLQRTKEGGRLRPVWVFTRAALGHGIDDMPKCRVVVYGSLSYYFLMARAGVWIFDTRHEGYLVKKKKVFYVQTWHGTPLKKLGLDMDVFGMAGELSGNADTTKAAERYKKEILKESAKWDLLISSSSFTTEAFRSCFGYTGEILECGYPRNDCLFEQPAQKMSDATGTDVSESGSEGNKHTGDKSGSQVILYAPTWRDDCYEGDGWYGYEPELDIRQLEKALAPDYRLVVKLHYLVKADMTKFPKECIDSGFLTVVGNERDIAGLYGEADILVTDYSSVMFDWANLHRPMYFFTYDLEKYREKLRGFYFDFEKEAPGPLCATTQELIDSIKNGSGTDGTDAYNGFIARYNTFEDGHASQKVIERILRQR